MAPTQPRAPRAVDESTVEPMVLGGSSSDHERAASHVADSVVEHENDEPRAAEPERLLEPEIAAGIAEVRRRGGHPLPRTASRWLARTMGRSLDHVRLHRGPDAAGLATRLDARAFTVGSDVFFGSREFRPEAPGGMRLLAHELVHTLQPGSEGTVRRSMAAARGSSAANEAPCSDEIPDVVLAHYWPDAEKRIAPLVECPRLIDSLTEPQVVEFGPELVSLLLDQGHTKLARRLLARMTGNQIPEAWKADIQVAPDSVEVGHAETLMEQAITAARDHEHGLAMEILAVVYGLAQIGLRMGSAEIQAEPLRRYVPDLDKWQGILKQIFALYPSLIRSARRSGDEARALEYQREWKKIRHDLLEEHTIEETPQHRGFGRAINAIDPVVIGVAELQSERHGQKQFELRGTDPESSTQLVSPLTQEQAANEQSTITDTMESIAGDLAAQQDLVTRIDQRPEVRAEFPDRPPNLRDREERIRVWAVVFEHAHGPRMPIAPFSVMMELIKAYLSAYTLHSSWNVADSGKTYLTQEMPTDIAGRLLQDCGVYAMSVATEAFAAVKRSGKGSMSSEIYFLPGHVVLALFDRTTGKFFLVNNDQIIGPRKGTETDLSVVLGVAGEAYSGVIGDPSDPVRDIVAPVGRVNMGSSDQLTESQFEARYWDRYSTVSSGYSALENAFYPNGDTGRKPFDQYEHQIREYRKDSKDMVTALDKLIALSDEELATKQVELESFAPTVQRMLPIHLAYGPESAKPHPVTGEAIAPRGGKTARQRQAGARLEKPTDPNISPHLMYTDYHPLLLLGELIERFLVTDGQSLDCRAAVTPVQNMRCLLFEVFKPKAIQ